MDRDPPEGVKLQLRQEAAFGCCICGHPIFQYHHIVEWAQEQHFRPEDMMVLCPNHHNQATAKALSTLLQRQAKANPYNREHGLVSGQLAVEQKQLTVLLGSNTYINTPILLEINSRPIVAMSLGPKGTLLLDLDLYGKDGNLVARVSKNEWEARADSTWDIEFRYRWLRLREAQRKISLEIDATKSTVEIRAYLWFKGQPIRLGPKKTVLGGNIGNHTIQDFTFEGGRAAISISI
ncbi:MAG: HNH endonuclease signature motif containing protein [Thermoplasmatota archaeon]